MDDPTTLKSVAAALGDARGKKQSMASQNEDLTSCEQALSSCDEAFDNCALNDVDTIVSSFLKNMTDDCSFCSVDETDYDFSEDCFGADGTLCTEVESLSATEREGDDILEDSMLCNEVANTSAVETKEDIIQEDCCGVDGTEVENSVFVVCCEAQDQNDDERRNDVVKASKYSIPEVRCEVDDQNSLLDVDSFDREEFGVDETAGTVSFRPFVDEDEYDIYKDIYYEEAESDHEEFGANGKTEIVSIRPFVDEDEYDIYKDIYCEEAETFESDYKFDIQNVLPWKERCFRRMESKSKDAPQRQNITALKRKQSSLRLQQRLEKIYYREKMIRDLDVKLAAWKNPKNKNETFDEDSVFSTSSTSMSLHSKKTGLEVIRLEL